MKPLLLFCLIVFLACATGCAERDPPYYSRIHGVVKDETTSLPIRGAHILVTWTEDFGTHASSSACTLIETGVTDEQGVFSIVVDPSRMVGINRTIRKYVKGGFPKIHIYKAGMMRGTSAIWPGRGIEQDDDGAAVRKSMNRFFKASKPAEITTTIKATLLTSTADSHDRIRQLLRDSHPQSDCSNGDLGRVKRYYQSIATEANAIAATEYEKATAAVIQARALAPMGLEAAYDDRPVSFPGVVFGPSTPNDNRNGSDHTSLMDAALKGDTPRVAALLRAGANPNRTSFVDANGYSALTIAIHEYGYERARHPTRMAKYLPVIKALLSSNATDVDMPHEPGSSTPLMWAAERSQDEVVELLLAHGANPGLEIRGKSPLISAEGAMRTIPPPSATTPAGRTHALLLNAQYKRTYREITLLRAACSGDAERVRKAIVSGANINTSGPEQGTPLICATRHAIDNPGPSHAAAARLIANIEGVDKSARFDWKTADEMATAARRKDLVELLR